MALPKRKSRPKRNRNQLGPRVQITKAQIIETNDVTKYGLKVLRSLYDRNTHHEIPIKEMLRLNKKKFRKELTILLSNDDTEDGRPD